MPLIHRFGERHFNQIFTIHRDLNAQTNKYEMYYRLGTDRRCCIDTVKTLSVHTPGGSTVLRKITSWPPS